ncbi:MAG: ABC transporter ATP-binding protein [Treponema sp.]|nr:ABC transporter ATP-binding protein [Treponema sp.]
MILRDIKKSYNEFSLCIDKLVVSDPGIYGLVGNNGCGKSTLAKIMTGLIEPDSGSIDTEGLTPHNITYIGRKPYMMDDTVYNNLVYPLKLRKETPDPELVDSLLDRMGFLNRKNQRAKSLSGGEQQKLSFLRAVIFKPKFIIADEAMTAMDLGSLDIFEKIIIEEQEKEKSIWIIISHQMLDLKKMCNVIYYMKDGRLEQ